MTDIKAAISDACASIKADSFIVRDVLSILLARGLAEDTRHDRSIVRSYILRDPNHAHRLTAAAQNQTAVITTDNIITQAKKTKGQFSISEFTRHLAAQLANDVEGAEGKLNQRVYGLIRKGAVRKDWFMDGRRSEDQDELESAVVSIVEASQPINVRGVFYQLVASGWPKTPAFATRIGRLLVKLREDDMVPWESISETGRAIHQVSGFDSLADALQTIADGHWYKLNPWIGLEERVQIWIEKTRLGWRSQ
jgi:hypothetical protein